MHLLLIENVSKTYNGIRVVDNVSFHIDSGELFALLGPNGAGKSTLLRIIAEGITHEGSVKMWGKTMKRWKIGYVPQSGALYENLSAYDNVKFYALLKRVPVKKAVSLMEMMDVPNKKVSEMSGGMKRKLSIVVALIGEPELLILDEPTVGLDVESRRELWKLIVEMKKDLAILLTTHYMEEADALADRIGIINNGRILAIDSPENLKKRGGIKSAIVVRGKFDSMPDEFVKDGDTIIKLTDHPREELPRIVKKLSELGEVSEISVREPTLEDAFIRITGRGLAE